MRLLYQLLWRAAKRIASDPRVRAKASEVYEGQVKPRAEAAWRWVPVLTPFAEFVETHYFSWFPLFRWT